MKKFNINYYIYIQITECGWRHLRSTVGNDYIAHCIEPFCVKIKHESWYKLQCHHVFDIMPINFGGQPYFNTNIMFDDEDLK